MKFLQTQVRSKLDKSLHEKLITIEASLPEIEKQLSEIDISYGGQAVIGGVLIQSPKGWSLGIRDKDENLHRYYEPRIPLIRRNKFWAAPFIRGFGALIDSM